MSAMVRLRGVHKSFGALHVLRGVDLDVRKGQVLVILGPSGSGKSTLLRTINHLEKVDRGSVRVDGQLLGYRQAGIAAESELHRIPEMAAFLALQRAVIAWSRSEDGSLLAWDTEARQRIVFAEDLLAGRHPLNAVLQRW